MEFVIGQRVELTEAVHSESAAEVDNFDGDFAAGSRGTITGFDMNWIEVAIELEALRLLLKGEGFRIDSWEVLVESHQVKGVARASRPSALPGISSEDLRAADAALDDVCGAGTADALRETGALEWVAGETVAEKNAARDAALGVDLDSDPSADVLRVGTHVLMIDGGATGAIRYGVRYDDDDTPLYNVKVKDERVQRCEQMLGVDFVLTSLLPNSLPLGSRARESEVDHDEQMDDDRKFEADCRAGKATEGGV